MGFFNDEDDEQGSGRKRKKIEPGDGHRLKPFRFWQPLSRSLFYAPLQSDEGHELTYAVSVDYFDWDDKADFYLNGAHHARAKLPATLPVEGGTIEVAVTAYGLKRMHFVTQDGASRVLQPDPASAEGLRAQLTRKAPGVSRAIGLVAILILLTLLPIGLLQIAEILSETEFAQQYMDPFSSPIKLPGWASTPALILSIVAATERALTLRHHWLVDMETGWFD